MKKKMKVYEIGVEDHYDDCPERVDCTIWVAVPEGINIECIIGEYQSNSYCKHISEYDEDTPGVDFIFHDRVAS